MQLKRLGIGGPRVSRMGLGLAALGRPGYVNLGHGQDLERCEPAALEHRTHQVLDAARQAGIRYIDTARSYGGAEAFLSSWLSHKNLVPGEISIGSKWGYTYTADWRVDAAVHEVKEHSLANFKRQWKESEALLGPYLGLYQIHSATLESGVLENAEVCNALAELRDDGLSIGLTTSGPDQSDVIRRALAIEIEAEPLFSCVQSTWNLLEPSAGEALAEAKRAGMGVIVKEGVANGRLTQRNPSLEGGTLWKVARERETGIDAIALAVVLAQPWCDVVLSGAATPSQLEQNLRALEVDCDEDLYRQLEDDRETRETYWTTRRNLAWN